MRRRSSFQDKAHSIPACWAIFAWRSPRFAAISTIPTRRSPDCGKHLPSDYIFPPPTGLGEERKRQLAEHAFATDVATETVFTAQHGDVRIAPELRGEVRRHGRPQQRRVCGARGERHVARGYGGR